MVFGLKQKIAHFACFVQVLHNEIGAIGVVDNTMPNFTMDRNKGYSGCKSVFPVPFRQHYSHTGKAIYTQLNRFAAPLPPISLVCQTKCNVFLPPKIIPAAYMESPRMGPNLPYKPATPNRKTSHTQSRKTSLPRTSQNRKTSHTHKVVKRVIRAYLRTGKRAIRVQRARLYFPL